MEQIHSPLRQTLGTGGFDIVAVHGIQHTGSGISHDAGCLGYSQGKGRQKQVVQLTEQGAVSPLPHREPVQVQAEQNNAEETNDKEKNPAISNPHWEDTNGNTITKALVGDEVYLCADVTDIDDGATATIKIIEKDDDGNNDDIDSVSGKVQDSKIKTKWKVIYTEDDDDSNSQQEKEEKGYTLPEYAFTVECDGVESEESGQLDIKDEIVLTVKNFDELKGKTLKLVWKDGSSKEIPIDSEELKIRDIFIGTACMFIK